MENHGHNQTTDSSGNVINIPSNYIAFIIDGVVQQVLATDSRFASIFLSNPKIVDLTGREDAHQAIVEGTYNEELDEFRGPQPFPSWTWDTNRWEWVPPIERPVKENARFLWADATLEWVEIPNEDISF
jgi:hypothetical protein